MKASFSFNSFTFTFDFILISIFYFYLFHKAALNLILKQDIFHQLLSTFYNITFTLEFRYQFQKSGIIYQSRTFVSLQKNYIYIVFFYFNPTLHYIINSIIVFISSLFSMFRGSRSHPWLFHQATSLPCRVRKSCE